MVNKLKKLLALVCASVGQDAKYIEPRMQVISIIAAICFPLYYVIWHDVFPQSYENLPLRLFGAALFIPIMLHTRWPRWTGKFKAIYWNAVMLFGMPFFFTFMLLKNNGSDVWLSSALVVVFLMLLGLGWLSFIVHFVLGVGLAVCAYYLTTDYPHMSHVTLEHIPIFLFVIVFGMVANYSAEMVRQERLRAMLAIAGNIAHELRTPLLGIKIGAAGLRQFLPALLAGYRMAREQGMPVEPIRQAHLQSMSGVLERIESEAGYSNTIIDMLLMNTRINGFQSDMLASCSMVQCVEVALQRYPFSTETERQLVTWNYPADFKFRGVELLMVHVVFNLLKNALYHIAKADKGGIVIHLSRTSSGNTLVFRDSGTGIPEDVLPHIFTRFYTRSSKDNYYLGAGIGLAFCQDVMTAFGGTIRCESQLGEYTEFVLTFPDMVSGSEQ